MSSLIVNSISSDGTNQKLYHEKQQQNCIGIVVKIEYRNQPTQNNARSIASSLWARWLKCILSIDLIIRLYNLCFYSFLFIFGIENTMFAYELTLQRYAVITRLAGNKITKNMKFLRLENSCLYVLVHVYITANEMFCYYTRRARFTCLIHHVVYSILRRRRDFYC